MNVDGGNLSFGTVIDTTGFDQGADKISEKVAQIGEEAEAQSAKINELLTNIPTVNIDVVTNAGQSLQTIQQGFDEIDRVVDTNKAAIRELEEEYKRLATEKNRAGQKGDQTQYNALKQEQEAIKETIAARKQVIAEAGKQADALQQVETKLKQEAEAAQKAATQHTSLRQQIRALKEEMADLVANGIDEQSEAYKKLVNELGRLTDIQGDISQQGKVLANDEARMAGVIQGLSGLSGAFTAAQGTVGLFAGENEELNKIMLKVQSLMAVTMGLQQVQQTLNKDSAFSLVTLNGLKEWWNKLVAVGIEEQTAETASTLANTASKDVNAVANASDAAAKEANAAASVESATAEGVDTVAKGMNTAAAGAGTVANIGLAGAFRMVGAAIKSIPVFGWIAAAIGAIIAVVGTMISKAVKAKEAANDAFNAAIKKHEEFNKAVADKVAEQITTYQKLSREYQNLGNNMNAQKKFIEANQNAFHGLGVQINNVNDANKYLVKHSNDVIAALLAQAKAAAAFDMAKEDTKKLIRLKSDPIKYKKVSKTREQIIPTASTVGYTMTTTVKNENYEKEQRAELEKSRNYRKKQIEETEAHIRKLVAIQENANRDYQKHLKNTGVKEYTGNTSGTKNAEKEKFDYGKSIAAQKAATDEWVKASEKYIKDANTQVSDFNISVMKDGMEKEIAQINAETAKKIQAWDEQLMQLAEIRKKATKESYMAKKGATEGGWMKSNDGKKTDEDWKNELLGDANISKEFYAVRKMYVEQGEKQIQDVQQKYTDELIDRFGTTEQKMEKLHREWDKKIAATPAEYIGEAVKQMNEDFSKVATEDFKKSINWESVFGNLDKQSLSSLQYTLDKVRTYFDKNKQNMSGTEIKDYQEAIKKMEEEIGNRNPFVALHKSLEDIKNSKTEFTNALAEWKTAQDALNLAQTEYNTALREKGEIIQQIDEGKLVQDCQELTDANERLKNATDALALAQEKNNSAEQRTINARNGITTSYRNFATQLKNVGGVVQNVGGRAKNLASIFSDDVARSIGKVLDFLDDTLDSVSSVINAIGDVGKNVASGVSSAVSASASGAQAAATAGAAAMSTVEKASVILTIISAALQVATAIANLFNNDDKKQKEIERLQARIDQLQWELDNADTVRLQERVGDAVERLRKIYAETTQQVMQLHLTTEQYTNAWVRYFAIAKHSTEIYQKSIEKIADAYAKVSYTADKALGEDKFKEARKQLENYAEQQILIQRQIQEESGKKKKDRGKIREWENSIREIAEKMISVINEMMEDIIGYSSNDLAKELSDAFFEAAEQGKDAMDGWRDKANEVVRDVMKRMLVSKLLEEPIGKIFDKYKAKWFGDDGKFKGIDNVINSMQGFSNDLNAVGEAFNEVYKALPKSISNIFTSAAEREGTSKGIATASQDSVDENNARLTTIQGHTYSLVQGMDELNRTGNQILEKVTGIEKNTDATNTKLDNMNGRIKRIEDNVEDIAIRGIKIKT